MEKDLQRVRSARQAVDRCFRQLEKGSKNAVNQLFHDRHDAVFREINCLDCARCCKTTGPLFTHSDIKRISRHLRISTTVFEEKYLRIDEDGDHVLQQLPCPFLLSDNACSIYEVRPKACMEYPHTDHSDMRSILGITRKNALICPAVAKITLQILQAVPDSGPRKSNP